MKILYFEDDKEFPQKDGSTHFEAGEIALEFSTGWKVNLYETWMVFDKLLKGGRVDDHRDPVWSTKHYHFEDLDKVNDFIRKLKNTPKEKRYLLKDEAFNLLLGMEYLTAPEPNWVKVDKT